MPWFSFRSASSRHKELLDPDTGTGTPRTDTPKDVARETKETSKDSRVSGDYYYMLSYDWLYYYWLYYYRLFFYWLNYCPLP